MLTKNLMRLLSWVYVDQIAHTNMHIMGNKILLMVAKTNLNYFSNPITICCTRICGKTRWIPSISRKKFMSLTFLTPSYVFQLSLSRSQGSITNKPHTHDYIDIMYFINPIIDQSYENILENSSKTKKIWWETRTKSQC